MIEPFIQLAERQYVDEQLSYVSKEEMWWGGLGAALGTAIRSIREESGNVPVGAAAVLDSGLIVGAAYASDAETGDGSLHAELRAIEPREGVPLADTIITTLEPCEGCQAKIAQAGHIKSVVFCLPRSAAEQRGIVAKRPSIFDHQHDLPYDVYQFGSPLHKAIIGAMLDHTHREPSIDKVRINKEGFNEALGRIATSNPFSGLMSLL